MKLEFEQNIVDQKLFNELSFNEYLDLFNIDVPLLPLRILRPLTKHNGEQHFHELNLLKSKVDDNSLALSQLISASKKIPYIENIIIFLKNKEIEQYHVYTLGKFLEENLLLSALERPYPILSESSEVCLKIKSILKEYTCDNYSMIRVNKNDESIKIKIKEVENILKIKLIDYEKQVEKETGLKLIYPYPKELDCSEELHNKLSNCNLISVKKKGAAHLIEYTLPSDIQEDIENKRSLISELDKVMISRLNVLNKLLFEYVDDFIAYYEDRKKRVYQYILISTLKKYNLVIPNFSNKMTLEISEGVLPSLKNQKNHKYNPLDIDLDCGSNVLFGANMAGKTTVLKTIFFQLTAIRMGLPTPAKNVNLRFPEQVEFHLKSSGNIQKNISSFGEEVEFFTKEIRPFGYILVDEFFQTTNPISGIELSQIFLKEFSTKDMIFFCNTQYPEIISTKDISLFRMKDLDFKREIEYNLTLNDLIGKIPYEVEKISSVDVGKALKESKNPLYIALHFPLSKSIKEKIKQRLDS